MDDAAFVVHIGERLAVLPAVAAVALGGSRAQGVNRPDSDWDFAVYYRGRFDPAALRAIGWPGEVSDVGGWGGGVFNGGAWLSVEGRRIDVHYRDLDAVEYELAEAEAGRFRIEQLLFHLAGIPSYLVVAELALGRVLTGRLPRPDYPTALRRKARQVWWTNAQLTLDYAAANYAQQGRVAECLGLIAQAALQSAHAVLAARGEWVTNEKRLLNLAGLEPIEALLGGIGSTATRLSDLVVNVRELCSAAVG